MRDILSYIIHFAVAYCVAFSVFCAGEFLWWLARGAWVLIAELVGLLGKRGVRR